MTGGKLRWRRRLTQGCLTVALFWSAQVRAQSQERMAGFDLPPLHARVHAEPPVQDVDNHILPISLDTVLRLAQDQNGQVGIARLRLQEAFAQHDLAGKSWLPELTVGTAYYRHEGGIQDFDGQFIHSSYGSLFAGLEMRGKVDLRDAAYQRIEAERKVWQQKGDLSKLTSETLLDAAGTYVDLVSAYALAAVSLENEKRLSDLAGLAQTLAALDQGMRVELVRIQSAAQGQKQATRKLHEGAHNAAAKLVYLLGLDPESRLVLLDKQIVAFELVDPLQPAQQLIGAALTRGPGVRELEGLLNLIEEARTKAAGPGRFIPAVEVTMAEGAFGAGPGAQSTWDNRWDMGLHVKWSLTQALTARERRRVADAQSQQVRLGYQDLRAKLALGVQEAREACLSAKDQLGLCERQIEAAEEGYLLSNSRLKENIRGRSPSEVLMAVQTVGSARLNYVQAVRDFDKAQLRLFVLTGGRGE